MSILEGRYMIELGMSNFGHTIDDGLVEALCADPHAYAQYSGWEFCAYVCVEPDADRFTCEVWRYGKLVETVEADALDEIMRFVSGKYGEK